MKQFFFQATERETIMISKKLQITLEWKHFQKDWIEKRGKTKPFCIKNCQLHYKESRLVIADKDRQDDIIHNIQEESGDTSHSKAMSTNLERTPTYEKNASHFSLYGVYGNVADYIQKCDGYRRQSSLPPNVNYEMHSAPVSQHSLYSLPKVDGCRHLIVCIDYFTKWWEAKPVRITTALTVNTFLYELMCCRGCFEVQVNDQGREFVNVASTCLHDLTSAEQRMLRIPSVITWSYREVKQNDRKSLGKSSACKSRGVVAYHRWFSFCGSPKSTFVNKFVNITSKTKTQF